MLKKYIGSLCLIVGLAGLPPAPLYAQAFPYKTVRIATAEAGGGADFTSRILAQGLTPRLGQQVIVENRPGGGQIVADYVAKASPDGHTLLVNGSTIWLAPFLQEKVPYDPVRDFAPISLTNRSPNLLVVSASLPVKSVRDLIDLAKSKPGQIDYGSANLGSTSHLSAELFKAMAGINLMRIPYKGTGQALNAVIAGQVQVMFGPAGSTAPHAKSGKVRALAVTSEQVSYLYPDLPAVAAAVPGYDAVAIHGIFAPAKTPTAIIGRLNQEIVAILNLPDVKERFHKIGVETVGSSPEQLAAAMMADMARTGKLIKDAGIRGE